eukprot:scaffold5904_cov134-Isochrysis_galbana.AAC.6
MTSSGHKYKYMSHVTAGPFQASAPTTISSQCPHDHRTPHSHTHFASASSAQSAQRTEAHKGCCRTSHHILPLVVNHAVASFLPRIVQTVDQLPSERAYPPFLAGGAAQSDLDHALQAWPLETGRDPTDLAIWICCDGAFACAGQHDHHGCGSAGESGNGSDHLCGAAASTTISTQQWLISIPPSSQDKSPGAGQNTTIIGLFDQAQHFFFTHTIKGRQPFLLFFYYYANSTWLIAY